jgi:hypothetical protein
MGAEGSKSFSVSVTRDTLLKSTARTRDIVDIIFDFMLNNIQLRDFYSLSSPERCKRYVLFVANELYSKFYEFRIFPTLDRSGSIMFRKVDDLTSPPEPELRRGQTACLHLAYFYVRIFQIYGALALTLVDDATYTQQTGIIGLMKSTSRVLPPPGSTEYRAPAPLRSTQRKPISISQQYLQTGGDIFPEEERRALKYFQPLESILRRPIFSFGNTSEPRTYGIRFDTGFGRDSQGCTLILGEGDTATISCKSFKLNLRAKLEDGDNVRIEIEDEVEITRRGKDAVEVELSHILQSSEMLSLKCIPRSDGRSLTWGVIFGRSNKQSTVPAIFNYIHDKIVRFIDLLPASTLYNGSFRNTRKQINSRTGGRDYNESRMYGKVFPKIPGVNKHLQLEAIMDGLTTKRKFAHCIGRAIQLLDAAPVFTGQVGSKRVSYVCDPKFSKESISGSAGIPLANATGIIALANLFYDTIPPNMLTVTVEEKESLNEYIDFMRRIIKTFTGRSDIKKEDPESMLRSLSSSGTTQRDEGICKDKFGQPIMIDNPEMQKKVYSVVQALFRYQIVHASKCAEILTQLFEMRKVEGQYSVRIHPNIMKKGLVEINRINKLARQVLVDYYERCETVYVNGMNLITKKPETAVPVVLDQARKAGEARKAQLERNAREKPALARDVILGQMKGAEQPPQAPRGILRTTGTQPTGPPTGVPTGVTTGPKALRFEGVGGNHIITHE